MLSVVFSVILCGQIVGKIGRYWHFLVGGPIFLALGCGLLYTIDEFAPIARIIGFQILAGVGVGSTTQNGVFATQAEFKDQPQLIGQATGMTTFSQLIGAIIALAASQATLSSELATRITRYAPEAPLEVIKESPLAIWTDLATDQIPLVIKGYVEALDIGKSWPSLKCRLRKLT